MSEAILTGVTLARDVFGDPRFHHLAQLLGLANHYEAIGRMGALWSVCTALGCETPPRKKIIACLGSAIAPEMLIEADLAELQEDGELRVKGCERTGWYGGPERGQAGGKARAADAPRDERGRLKARDPAGSHQQAPANHQQPPAASSGTSSTVQPKIKIKDQSPDPAIPQAVCETAISLPPTPRHTPFDPTVWSPEPSDANTHAALEASVRGVVVEYALKKFRTWAVKKRWPARRCADEWPLWLLKEHPTAAAQRDALVAGDRKKTTRIAVERTRAEIEERDRLAQADRAEVLRIAHEHQTQKATG